MYGRIVVGVAKTDSAKRAIEVAVDLAQRFEADLHLVMAFDRGGTALDSASRKDAEAFLASIEATAPVPVQLHAIPGDPADTVLMVADEVRRISWSWARSMQGARGSSTAQLHRPAPPAPC
jgi:nucleotide-binding universal stress UspA family protein